MRAITSSLISLGQTGQPGVAAIVLESHRVFPLCDQVLVEPGTSSEPPSTQPERSLTRSAETGLGGVTFEWAARKAAANLKKRRFGVRFSLPAREQWAWIPSRSGSKKSLEMKYFCWCAQ
jgi:hypothetical protein